MPRGYILYQYGDKARTLGESLYLNFWTPPPHTRLLDQPLLYYSDLNELHVLVMLTLNQCKMEANVKHMKLMFSISKLLPMCWQVQFIYDIKKLIKINLIIVYDNTIIIDILLYAIFLKRASHINKFMHSFFNKGRN